MNIFLTGGNGLIGYQVSFLLEKIGHKIISFDKSIKYKNREKTTFLKGDILNEKKLSKILKKNKIDIFLHFAANLGVEKTEKNGLDCLTVNIEGTKKILQACVRNKVKKVIFASSSEVYGNGFKKPIKEDSELMPKSSYGVSKVAGEAYMRAFYEKYGLKYNILRFFNIYGPEQRNDFVISKFRKIIQNNKTINIYGKGEQTRAFCHVNDAARAVALVIKKGKRNEIYNIGNDLEPIKIINLAKKMIRQSKKKIKIARVPFNKSDRSISREIFKRQPNIDKLKKHTKYKPLIDLVTGLNSVLQKKI